MFLGTRIGQAGGVTSSLISPPTPVTDPYWANVILYINGEGGEEGGNNKTFADISSTGLSGSITGATTASTFVGQGSFAPYSTQGWGSIYCYNLASTAGNQFVSFPSNTALALGTGDFTIECWVYIVGFIGGFFPIFQMSTSTSSAAGVPWLMLSSTPASGIQMGVHGGVSISATATFATGTWYHIAICKTSSTVTMYVNGTAVTVSSTNLATFVAASLGQAGAALGFRITPNFANGYISNFRVVKGSVLYTGNFTPSTTPLTPVSGTVLLVPGNSGSILDHTRRASISTRGSIITTGKMKRFGNNALYFNGASPWPVAMMNGGQVGSIKTGDFTVECWVNVTTGQTGGTRAFISQYSQNTVAENAFLLGFKDGRFEFYYGPFGGTVFMTGSITYSITAGVWQHVAVTRSGTTFTMWVNGKNAGSVTSSLTGTASPTTPYVLGGTARSPNAGGTENGVTYLAYDGYLDEIKVTAGVARYTNDFSPTSKQTLVYDSDYATNADYFIGKVTLRIDGDGVDGSTAINDTSQSALAITVGGSANVQTANKYFKTGSLALNGTSDFVYTSAYTTKTNLSNAADWCVDFMLRPSSLPSTQACLFCEAGTTGASYTAGVHSNLYLNSTGQLVFEYYSSGVLQAVTPAVISAGVWQHVAIVYIAATKMLRIFVGGKEVFNGFISAFPATSSTTRMTIGAEDINYATHNYFAGNIDRFRLTNSSRYTTNFVPD